jgi:hypothetical protein
MSGIFKAENYKDWPAEELTDASDRLVAILKRHRDRGTYSRVEAAEALGLNGSEFDRAVEALAGRRLLLTEPFDTLVMLGIAVNAHRAIGDGAINILEMAAEIKQERIDSSAAAAAT